MLVSLFFQFTWARSIETIRAAVPLLFAMRHTIKPAPTLEVALNAKISAQLLSKCLGAVGWPTGYCYDTIHKTGVSYDELVRQCCEATDNTVEQVSSATNQLFLITKLRLSVGNDQSLIDMFLDCLIERHYVSFAACTMLNMEASQDPQVRHDTDRHRRMDVQDTCIMMLLPLLRRAEDRATAAPAIEAVESHLLFVLEKHSLSAIEFAGGELSQLG